MMHVWRRKMHVSWNEMRETPQWVIEEDLEIMDMEAKFGNKPTPKKKGLSDGNIR